MKVLSLTNKAYSAGIVIGATGRCIDAAPILRWMIGKGEKWIRHHCEKHQIHIEEAGEIDAQEPLT